MVNETTTPPPQTDETLSIIADIAASHALLHSTLDAMTAQILILNEAGVILITNATWDLFAEANHPELADNGIGMKYHDLYAILDGKDSNRIHSLRNGIYEILTGQREIFHLEFLYNGPKKKRWFNLIATHFHMAGINRIVVVHEDINESKLFEEELAHNAFYDVLTGLPNRRLFLDRLKHALHCLERNEPACIAVLYLDLDQFKLVNDSFGHHVGDKLLIAIGQRLQTCLRLVDTLARMGGDEFIILMEAYNNTAGVVVVADRILELFEMPFSLDGKEICVSLSIGICEYNSNDQKTMEDLLRDSDTALHYAKVQGKGCFKLFDKTLSQHVKTIDRTVNDLQRAIQKHEFRTYYQPIVSLKTGRIAGAEALIRWRHPKRGLIAPADFIPLAEMQGMIRDIGGWILRNACRQAKSWQDKGHLDLRMAVNISVRQLQQQNFAELVKNILGETAFPASCLELEITETAAMHDTDYTIKMFKCLMDLGARISIDDFGSGYSSLAYLKLLPVHTLKIDRSFICDLVADSKNAAIVTAVIIMAHNLGLNVIAEGVESEAALNFLRDHRCDFCQGYLFSEPVPADSFEKLLQIPYFTAA